MLERLHGIVDGGRYGNRAGLAFDWVTGIVIVVSMVEAILSTDPAYADYDGPMLLIEAACTIFFGVEYALRMAVTPFDRQRRFMHPVWGRLRYALSPMGLIDLAAFLPLLFKLAGIGGWETPLVLSCVRLLKLTRYFSALDTLAIVVRDERKPLIAAMTLMAGLLVVVATLAHVLERDIQPDAFGSIPKALWWGIVTLTTVGYGDVVPVTGAGRMLGAVAVVLGMGMFALPAAILATGFAEEMRRRNFTVTWNLVARVPIFEQLSASQIAEIAGILEPRTAVRGEEIVRTGERADGMYFLIEGEVLVELLPESVRLVRNSFFGEMGLINDAPRSATVIAASFCQLLKLRADHFGQLVRDHPEIETRLRAAAARRLAANSDAAAALPPDAEAPPPGAIRPGPVPAGATPT